MGGFCDDHDDGEVEHCKNKQNPLNHAHGKKIANCKIYSLKRRRKLEPFSLKRVQSTELVNPCADGEELCCEGGWSRLVGVRLWFMGWAPQQI